VAAEEAVVQAGARPAVAVAQARVAQPGAAVEEAAVVASQAARPGAAQGAALVVRVGALRAVQRLAVQRWEAAAHPAAARREVVLRPEARPLGAASRPSSVRADPGRAGPVRRRTSSGRPRRVPALGFAPATALSRLPSSPAGQHQFVS
jgi:hypothetical protein